MADAQIMVVITDEVLAFALDQPRHATSMQLFRFLQMITKNIKGRYLFVSFWPPRVPPLFLFIVNFKKIKEKKKICENHLDPIPAPSQTFFPPAMTRVVQNCLSLAPRQVHLYASQHERREQVYYMHQIHTRISLRGYSTNEKLPSQFSNLHQFRQNNLIYCAVNSSL